MTRTFDAIVVGAGQAGPSLAVRLAHAGMRVALIERKHYGGTCVNDGCMPTKTLVASAQAAYAARRAADYGVEIKGEITVDMRRVKARKDEVVRRASAGVRNWLANTQDVHLIEGHARFESSTELRVGDELLGAPRIFLNVGGRALVPPMPGVDEVRYLTNSSIMDLDILPEHLIVVGGSYIGLEFAQMYRRFGARVTVIEKFPQLIGREDPDVSQAVHDILRDEGVAIELNAQCIAFAKRSDGVAATLDCGDGARVVAGTHVLLAVGRVPNTDDLGLAKAGVAVDARGYILVDDALKTNVPGIWAIGDCNGRGAFTHTAYNDYEIVAANLLDGASRSVRDRISAYGLFIDPPLGRVGMTDAEIRKSGRRALVGMRPMSRVGRAVEKGETRGFMKIAVDTDSKEILGAAILGVGGDEAIHSVVDVMYTKAPYDVLARAVNIHPTVSELIPTLLAELRPLQ